MSSRSRPRPHGPSGAPGASLPAACTRWPTTRRWSDSPGSRIVGAAGVCAWVPAVSSAPVPRPVRPARAPRTRASGCSWNSRASRVSDPRRMSLSPRRFPATLRRKRIPGHSWAPRKGPLHEDNERMRRFLSFGSTPLFLLLLGALAFQGIAHGQTRDLSTQGQLLDRIAAVVNDGVVLESEVDDQMKQVTARLQAQNMTLPPDSVLRKQVLNRLIIQRIQLEQAQRDGVTISDDQLNAALEDVAKRNNIAFADLPTVLAQQGIDYASYREDMRQQLTLGLLRQRDVLQRIVVTPREIDQFLSRQAKQPAADEEYSVSHILIAEPPNATPQQMTQAQQRADDVYHRASKGEDFAKLAVAYSNSEDALEGGSLGWRKGSELPTFLTSVILALKPGQVA